MTQAPPAPAAGVSVPPIALVANTTSAVPFPTLPGGKAPVPWRTPYIVVLNSSPFTLVVAQAGQVITQIAAFTSDKAFVVSQGNQLPVTLQAVPGSGTVAVGQDSTAYVTWYAADPGNTYPAALGSGAANFAISSTIIPLQNANTPGGGGLTTFGPFATSGFGGLTLLVQTNGAGTQPIQVTVDWLESSGTTVVASRYFALPVQTAGITRLEVALANLGPQVRIRVQTVSLANPYTIVATLNTQPVESFAGINGFGNIVGDGVILFALNNVQVVSAQVYGGPATLTYEATSGLLWDILLEAFDPLGAVWRSVLHLSHSGGQPNQGSIPIMVPTLPLRLTNTQSTAAPMVMQSMLLVDSFRAGG